MTGKWQDDRNMAGGRKIVVSIQGETEKERRDWHIKEKTGGGEKAGKSKEKKVEKIND